MKIDTETKYHLSLATVINPDLSLYTGTLCTSLDVSSHVRKLVLTSIHANTQALTTTPETQEVDPGVSCQCPRNAEGVPAPDVPRYIRSRRTALHRTGRSHVNSIAISSP